MKVFISSCLKTSESLWGAEIKRMAGFCKNPSTVFTDSPTEADLILVVDIYPQNAFLGLRKNSIWKKFPDKSFAIYEGDDPPNFLHGLFASVPQKWLKSGRFASCAYPIHKLVYPNPIPIFHKPLDKNFLFSFAGRNCNSVRDRLFNTHFPKDVHLEDTSDYYHFEDQDAKGILRQKRYWEMACQSKFVLCPRGRGFSSIRLFEMMELGIAPVVISDQWTPPHGPDWDNFCLRIPESKLSSIYEIIKSHESEWEFRGKKAKEAYEKFFAPDTYWNFIVDSINFIQTQQKVSERSYCRLVPIKSLALKLQHANDRVIFKLKSRINRIFKMASKKTYK
jgi:hypothetical protein